MKQSPHKTDAGGRQAPLWLISPQAGALQDVPFLCFVLGAEFRMSNYPPCLSLAPTAGCGEFCFGQPRHFPPPVPVARREG